MAEMALSIDDNFDFQDVVVSLEVPRFSSGLAIFTNEVRRASVRQHLISSVANTFSEAAAHSGAWLHHECSGEGGAVLCPFPHMLPKAPCNKNQNIRCNIQNKK